MPEFKKGEKKSYKACSSGISLHIDSFVESYLVISNSPHISVTARGLPKGGLPWVWANQSTCLPASAGQNLMSFTEERLITQLGNAGFTSLCSRKSSTAAQYNPAQSSYFPAQEKQKNWVACWLTFLVKHDECFLSRRNKWVSCEILLAYKAWFIDYCCLWGFESPASDLTNQKAHTWFKKKVF